MNITTCLFTVLGGMATLGHPSETIRLNQLGYYPQQEKVAVVNTGEVREFTIVSRTMPTPPPSSHNILHD